MKIHHHRRPPCLNQSLHLHLVHSGSESQTVNQYESWRNRRVECSLQFSCRYGFCLSCPISSKSPTSFSYLAQSSDYLDNRTMLVATRSALCKPFISC